LEKQILRQAIEQIESNHWSDPSCRGLVLAAEGWHAGVIGIVASRIVDRYRRPTVMLALSNGEGHGSARSIAGFHLAAALENCHHLLLTHGGHEMAAGLRLETSHLEEFRKAFCDFAQHSVTDEMLLSPLRLECVADISQLSQAVVTDLRRLGPFGHGNPKPLLCIQNATVAAPPRRVGKAGDHLQLHIKQGDQTIKCIAFGHGDLMDRLSPGTVIDLAVEPDLNEFNGRVNVELHIKDVHFSA
jgi:single-stranded-DNA-specific exonuclease